MRIAALFLGLLVAGACKSSTAPGELAPGTTRVTGIVQHYTIEGGFWAVRGDDNVTYDPIGGMPADFQQENLRVSMVVKLRPDMGGIHGVGPMVEIIQIQKI